MDNDKDREAKMKKSIALVMVWGIIIVMCLLALAAIYVMGNQSFVAEHKIRRTQSLYTARAGLVHAYEDVYQDGILDSNSITVTQSYGDMIADITLEPIPAAGPEPFQGNYLNITVNYTVR